MVRLALWAGVCLALAGCSVVPGAGPTTAAITDRGNGPRIMDEGGTRFAFVETSLGVARRASAARAAEEVRDTRFPPDTAAPEFTISEGDALSITIVNVNNEGFVDFTQSAVTPISTTALPEQEVGSDGRLQVPPVGRVRAAGLTPEQLERRLRAALSEELISPWVIVRVVTRENARAAIVGRVASPGSFQLGGDSIRLRELLARAGGYAGQAEDLRLKLNRDGRTYTLPLETALAEPRYNIRIWPGDVITLEGARRIITALGAVGGPREITVDRADFSLAQALGQVGGQRGDVADREGVFVFRTSPSARLASLGRVEGELSEGAMPAIYRFDMTDPEGIFAARAFEMADGDVIFVSDSLIAEIRKVFSIVTTVVGNPLRVEPLVAN